jgi:hypothetical protein
MGLHTGSWFESEPQRAVDSGLGECGAGRVTEKRAVMHGSGDNVLGAYFAERGSHDVRRYGVASGVRFADAAEA